MSKQTLEKNFSKKKSTLLNNIKIIFFKNDF